MISEFFFFNLFKISKELPVCYFVIPVGINLEEKIFQYNNDSVDLTR